MRPACPPARAWVVALLLVAGCGPGRDAEVVPTAEVVRREVVERLRFHGKVEPRRRLPVKSPFDSTLLSRVDHGSRVEEGEVVGTVDAVPHERELEVLEAELEEAQGLVDLAVFELDEARVEAEEGLREARRRLARAEVSLESLTRGRDVVGMVRLELALEVDHRTLERLEEELTRQRPFVEKGYVSEQEIRELESRIEQLRFTIEKNRLEHEILAKGPPRDKVADRLLEVQKAKAGLEKAREKGRSRVTIAGAKLGRARARIGELEEQVEDRRARIAECAMTAPAAGIFLESQRSMFGAELVVGARAWSMFPIGHVAAGGECEVVFSVAEAHLSHLEVGREIRFTPVSDRRRSFPARIREVSRVASFEADDPVGVRWVEARADILVEPGDYGPVQPGLNAEVELSAGAGEQVWALSARALAGSGVLLADDSFRPLELGRVGLAWAEVRGGLGPGELVRVPGARDRLARPVTATRGELVETYEEGGELIARDEQLLYNNEAESWRTKITWLIEEGSEVTTGTVCVKLDPGNMDSELESLVEELEVAKVELEKAEAESLSAIRAAEQEVGVLGKRVRFLEAEQELLEAGTAPEVVAKEEADLAALRVDEQSLRKKLELTREMEGRGFSGAREVAELEERWMRARARVKVKEIELELARQGATERERELARIDVVDARARLDAVRGELERLRRKQEIQLAASRANLRAKQRKVERKRSQVESMNLTADRAGTVVYRKHRNDRGERVPFESGSFARRGEGIVAVADLDELEVEGLVSEEIAYRVQPGQPAEFWLPSFPEERFRARVEAKGRLPEAIPDGAGEQGLRVTLEVLERSRRLQPGMQVRYEIELARYPDIVLVPLAAARGRGDEDWVTMADGTSRRVTVKGRDEEHAAISEGLAAGEVVLVP